MTHLPPRKGMDLYEFWFRHLLAWQNSEMNQWEYCEVDKLPLKRFGNWRATLRAEMPSPPRRLLYRRSVILSHMSDTMTNKESQSLTPGYLPPPPPTLPEPRSHFSPADKRNIVAEIAKPGNTVSGVARRYGIASQSLFRWKKEYAPKPDPIILPVTIVDAPNPAEPAIEATLANGHRVAFLPGTDAEAISVTIAQLERAPS